MRRSPRLSTRSCRPGGLARHLADTPPTAATVRFRPDDGSLSALLRAIQPALELDEAGLLTLSNHGSTAAALLTSAEALLLAASVDGALVLGDDFGDGLDAATAEHLAAVLRARSAQVWLTTRRPEVARAFAPGELVRLVRDGRTRTHHLVPQPADRHRAAAALPLAAAGVRLISADNGSGGGTGQIPRVAELAHAMGFRAIALIDSDPAKTSAAELADIDAACDAVVRLPASTGIELALLTGVDVAVLRAAAAVLPAYGVPDPTSGVTDADVPKAIAQLLHKKGLHEQFLDPLVDELGSVPPVLDAALTAVAIAADVTYAGPRRIDLAAPAPPAAASAP
jgi:putative ATP-dependent endonuclease of the OLD family